MYDGWTQLILTLKNVIDIYKIFITLINVDEISGAFTIIIQFLSAVLLVKRLTKNDKKES